MIDAFDETRGGENPVPSLVRRRDRPRITLFFDPRFEAHPCVTEDEDASDQ
jgi:hypothetical protein